MSCECQVTCGSHESLHSSYKTRASQKSTEQNSSGNMATNQVTSEDVVTSNELESDHGRNKFWFGYALSLERFPFIICILIVIFTIGCGGLTYGLHGLPSFEEPRLGFETRGTEIGRYLTSLVNLQRHDGSILNSVPPNFQRSLDSSRTTSFDTLLQSSTDDFDTRSLHFAFQGNEHSVTKRQDIFGSYNSTNDHCPTPEASQLKVIFETSDMTSLFEASKLISICQREADLIRSHQSFQELCIRQPEHLSCCPSWSLGYAVARFNDKPSCLDITDDDVENARKILERCEEYFHSGDLELSCDLEGVTCSEIPQECTKDNLVFIALHYLIPKASTEDDTVTVDFEYDTTTFSMTFSPMSLCFGSAECEDLIQDIYNDNFQSDLNDGVTRIVGVDFGLKFVLFDQFLVSDFLYVLLGCLAAFCIIWLYTHSVFITACAILNMFMSLIMAYFIYFVILRLNFFPFVNVISAVLIIGIGADDTFVYMDLWRAAKLKIGEGKEKRVLVLEETCKHAFATMFVTSLTTSAALFSTMISDITAIKCFAAYAGSAVLVNFLYTVTWLPAVIVIHDKYLSINLQKLASRSDQFCNCFEAFAICKEIIAVIYNTPKTFFEVALPKVIWKLRFMFLALFTALGVCGFFIAFINPRLGLPEKNEFQLFRDDHLFELYDQVYKDNFLFDISERPILPIYFVWGIDPIDTGNYWDPNDTGELKLDEDFQFGSFETQLWFSEFCSRIKEQTFIDSSNTSNNFCFIDQFRQWMNRPCFQTGNTLCCSKTHFPFPKVVFDECVKQFALFSCESQGCANWIPGLRFDENDALRAIYLYFKSTHPYTLQFQPVDEFWKEMQAWTRAELEGAPEVLQKGWTVSQLDIQLYFYDLQAGIASGTATSVSVSLAVATIVLLVTTQNIFTTLYAIITIACAVFVLIGVLVLLGWELNVFESAILSLAVGLSVDFTIHYGVAYKLAPDRDRKGRAIYAVKTLSGAITIAAVSTFTAGALMLPATVINYVQLGVFLTLVMSISWMYANFLFLPLCLIIGPNGNFGQIPIPGCTSGKPSLHKPNMPDEGSPAERPFTMSAMERPSEVVNHKAATPVEVSPLEHPNSVGHPADNTIISNQEVGNMSHYRDVPVLAARGRWGEEHNPDLTAVPSSHIINPRCNGTLPQQYYSNDVSLSDELPVVDTDYRRNTIESNQKRTRTLTELIV
ncbi:Protein dispatched-like 1 [Holothuria leucospilota]|uniref:Protein dispatched-like 1 n=1 Tax=Holothuria leucospilota TaxID=206669 RepID=A0A9Q1HER6_HOLLE|nr:Protein dispatched-like 1 [Holothuria leucospilota]